ncbi:hypothetical protein Pfo_010530 [Paulownia fortunei]|nr:hypothetical protein Pfo_010530 [Paulownia fortunei]
MEGRSSKQKQRLEWQPAVPELISGAEFCPNAIDEYKGRIRMRYCSPDGELFYSLCQVCVKFDHVCQELGPGSQMVMSPNIGRKIPESSPEETLSPPLAGKSQASSELSKLCTPSDDIVIEPEYCPEAVRDYYILSLGKNKFLCCLNSEGKLRALKAKKHLSAIGWSFYYHQKGDKREMRYSSPSGTLFYSLLSACKWCVEAGALTSSLRMGNVNVIKDFGDHSSINKSHLPLLAAESPGNSPLVNDKFLNLPNESSDISMSNGLVPLVEGEVYKTRISRKKTKHDKSHCIEGSQLPKRGRKPRVSMKVRGDMDADSTTPVRRSTKRVRDMVASSRQQTPRTVLSWLIDNNVVLPRARVQYRGRNNVLPMAEGRITHEGIKCSCCGESLLLVTLKHMLAALITDHQQIFFWRMAGLCWSASCY